MEWLLPTGASLTVVGKAVKDDSGEVWIECPHDGPFYVAPMTFDELVEHVQKNVRGISVFMKSAATVVLLLITVDWVRTGLSYS
ncbi:unnamed protein product [Linum tenue]|uniref:RING-type E3 ubiquitin transferase n=1 Tax=Linum tenue TaxID=586396 RepID=A0AAV0L229_9ROSI|nr:unnamed protein product [Linum tenue]